MKHFRQFIAIACLFGTAACAVPTKVQKEAKYWQRIDTTSQIYLRGPKAQHTLNHDIANCVVEVKELIRLGSIREAMPPDTLSHNSRSDGAPSYSYVAGYDTPQYDGANYAAYYDYADFEGCMHTKGWQRVQYLPYKEKEKADKNYLRTIFGWEDDSEPQGRFPNDYPTQNPDFQNLN